MSASFLTSHEPPEIFDKIFSYLNMADFLVFRKVCKQYYKVEHLQRRFNINILLRPFVSYPQMFRSELGKHDTLISGGFALNFFGLGWSNVSVLDLFVEAGRQKDGLVNYIKDREGYDKEDNLEITTVRGFFCWTTKRICSLLNFLQGVARFIFSSSKRPGKTIRLTATHGPPVETIIRYSYATTSVNFITWNKAYSIFPMQTLIHRKCHPLRLWNDEFGSLLREQVSQGWTNRDVIWPELTTDARHRISNGHRRVGDQSSLTISLDTNDVQKASTPDSAIEFAQFEIFTELESPFAQVRSERRGPSRIRVQELKSPALRHGYTFASSSWRKFVIERLQRWVWLELLKLKAGERPEQFENGIPNHSDISLPSDFQSETWDYADDQIPAWYKEWEQTLAEKTVMFDQNQFSLSL